MHALHPPESVQADPVSDLLLHWHALRLTGERPAVEELCADCPELTEAVRKRIAALESMEALLGVSPNPATTAEDGAVEPLVPGLNPHAIPGYELLGVIGHGGMGIVYKARQEQPRRLVALKMCLAGPQATPEQLARFRIEAEAAAGLQHPNIVRIHAVGEFRGQPYFAMEYVEGGTLAERLTESVLPPREAAALTRTLAAAIAAAHEQGIVHRDLKPANILLQELNHERHELHERSEQPRTSRASESFSCGSCLSWFSPKITDFGLAKRLDIESHDWHTRTGAVLGTVGYMAPEQASGLSADIGPAVDTYALGTILYEMLTGRPPFKGETPLETLDQVRSQEPLSPSRLRTGVPRDLETICLKCLAKEPGRRYASARALAEDLGRFLAGEPIAARPVSLGEKAFKWVKRKPAHAALVLAGVALLGVWVGYTIALESARRDAEREALRAKEQEVLAKLGQEEAQLNWTAATRQRERADGLLEAMCNTVEKHAQALTQAKNDPVDTSPGAVLFALARTYARSASDIAENGEFSAADRQRLAERYAARSLKLLDSAAALGYFKDREKVHLVKTDKELAGLRGRADFDRWLTGLTLRKE